MVEAVRLLDETGGGAPASALCGDGRRSAVALLAGVGVPLVAGLVMVLTGPPGGVWVATGVVLVLMGWNIFALVYVVMTLRLFGTGDAAVFRSLMSARSAMRPRLLRAISPDGDGPNFAFSSALLAFAVVLVLPHIDAINVDELVLVPITLSILLSSWALSIVAYALHYAQYDLAEPGLEFPGSRTNTFADYRYFSIAVATTFGATDVNITSPRMRRVVNLHTLLTFVYNSVIVALLASLLIR